MPFNIGKWFLALASDGLTMVFSTPLLSKHPWILNGHRVKQNFYFVPQLPNTNSGMSIGAIENDAGVALIVDEASGISNPQEIIDLFIKNNKEVLRNFHAIV